MICPLLKTRCEGKNCEWWIEYLSSGKTLKSGCAVIAIARKG